MGHCQAIPDLDHVKLHRIQQNDECISRIWQRVPYLLWGVHTQEPIATHGRSILPTLGLPWDIQFHIVFWVVAAIHRMILRNNETLQVCLWRLKLGHRLTGYLKCGIKFYCINNNRIGLDVNKKIFWCTFSEFPPRVDGVDTLPAIHILYLLVAFFIIEVFQREYHKNGKLLNT